ncbi:MAG: sulfurtransferase TusA family protein [Gammaproteobacteria bacterium]|nr:sulfurtransferase TusA family protein [Gammaproteobacteria bacterium]
MEQELDARRILCPLPVIRTQDAVARLSPGDVLRVIATDPGVVYDIPAWCKVHGHKVLAIEEGREEICLTIEVGG